MGRQLSHRNRQRQGKGEAAVLVSAHAAGVLGLTAADIISQRASGVGLCIAVGWQTAAAAAAAAAAATAAADLSGRNAGASTRSATPTGFALLLCCALSAGVMPRTSPSTCLPCPW